MLRSLVGNRVIGVYNRGSPIVRQMSYNTILIREQSPKNKSMIHIDMKSIKKFKEIYGHLFIPQKFCFEPTMEGVGYCGWELGMHAMRIRRLQIIRPEAIAYGDRRELDKLGFVWRVWPAKFMRLLNGVATYQKIYGDNLIPINFTVPHGDPLWSNELWDCKLGDMYRNVWKRTLTKGQSVLMAKNNIPVKSLQNRKVDKVLQALKLFKTLYVSKTPPAPTSAPLHSTNTHATNTDADSNVGNGAGDEKEMVYFYVAKKFIVPENSDDWPEELWGYKLGNTVANIRYKDYYASRRSEVEEVGLSLSPATDELIECKGEGVSEMIRPPRCVRAKKAMNVVPVNKAKSTTATNDNKGERSNIKSKKSDHTEVSPKKVRARKSSKLSEHGEADKKSRVVRSRTALKRGTEIAQEVG